MRILFFGDVVGKTGRRAVTALVPKLKQQLQPDLIIANAENVAHGLGMTVKTVQALFEAGVDVLTSGNHAFDKQEQVEEIFSRFGDRIIRPVNFEGQYPGRGWLETRVGGQPQPVVVANFNSQVFMERQFAGLIASPFTALDRFLHEAPKSAIIVVDFHSEATSEKRAFGFYADGRLAAVWGTHTHVQTADAQILPGGTAYISDVGMVGAQNSVIGVQKEKAVQRFLSGSEVGLEVDEGSQAEAGYITVDIDERTRRAVAIRSNLERLEL